MYKDRGCAEHRPQCSAGTWRATGQSSRRHPQEHKAVQMVTMGNGVRPCVGVTQFVGTKMVRVMNQDTDHSSH